MVNDTQHSLYGSAAESEQTKDDAYPADSTGGPPIRQKVQPVRLSAGEESQVRRVAAVKHLPASTPVRFWILERLDRSAPPDTQLTARSAGKPPAPLPSVTPPTMTRQRKQPSSGQVFVLRTTQAAA